MPRSLLRSTIQSTCGTCAGGGAGDPNLPCPTDFRGGWPCRVPAAALRHGTDRCGLQGPAEPLLEQDGRLISQHRPDPVERRLGVTNVAGPRRLELWLQVGPEYTVDRPDQLEQADPAARSDVQNG